MKHFLLVAAVLISMCAFAQKKPGAASEGDLESVLSKMDQASAGFKSAQAGFQWDQYQASMKKIGDVQSGTVYFRRNNTGIDAAFDITSPAPKVILFTSKDGKLHNQPGIEQVTERDVTKNKSDVEAVMSLLGFGGRGHDLPRSYQVKMIGWETVDNVKTARLELIPKDDRFRNVVSRMLLWIDPERDISLKQQFFEPSGDYRLAHYTGIKLNTKISDEAFNPNTSGEGDLESVLSKMDQASAGFKSAQASFQWDQYQDIMKSTDVQNGTVYFRRNNKGMDAAFDITSPAPKVILFTGKDGKVRIYEPRIDQVTQRDVTKNKSDVEAVMSLGFGGRGHDLPRSYQVKMMGWETVDNIKTAKLELIPKDDKFRNVVSRILLWMDPDRDISLKQQFFEPSGDYRLAHYTGIKLNEKISDDAFKLKTSSSTKVVTP